MRRVDLGDSGEQPKIVDTGLGVVVMRPDELSGFQCIFEVGASLE